MQDVAGSKARCAALLIFSLLSLAAVESPDPTPDQVPAKVRAVDALVVADRVFSPGKRAVVRVITRGVINMTQSQPLPLARVSISLGGKDRPSVVLFASRSDLLGVADARMEIPSWPDGVYEMEVAVDTPFGQSKVVRPVTLMRDDAIVVTCDKAAYQPGQTMYLRMLYVDAGNQQPLPQKDLKVAILDARGSQVFLRTVRTNEHGIAATEFLLATEVHVGAYQIRVSGTEGESCPIAEKKVWVEQVHAPRLKVEVETDRDAYAPLEVIQGRVRVQDLSGKPQEGAEIELTVSSIGETTREFSKWKGQTDGKGRWPFEVKLPGGQAGWVEHRGKAVLQLNAQVKNEAQLLDSGSKLVPVLLEKLHLEIIPDSGRVVVGVSNRLLLRVSSANGLPAKATVRIRTFGKSERELGAWVTDKEGHCSIDITPTAADLRDGGWRRRGSIESDLESQNAEPDVYVPSKVLEMELIAKDEAGNQVRRVWSAPTDLSMDRLSLRTDKAVYDPGEALRGQIFSNAPNILCYLDLVQNKRTLATWLVALKNGIGEFHQQLDPDVVGAVELRAYFIENDADAIQDARMLYVQPSRHLTVTVAQDKPVYGPGEQAHLRLLVADSRGKPSAAAMGLAVVSATPDTSLVAQPSRESLFFGGEGGWSPSFLHIRPGSAQLWAHPQINRLQQAEKDHFAFLAAFSMWQQQGHPLGNRGQDGRLSYRPELLQELLAAGLIPEDNQRDPLDQPYSLDGLSLLWPDLHPGFLLPILDLSRLWKARAAVFEEVLRRTAGFSKMGPLGLEKEIAAAAAFLLGRGALKPEWLQSVSGKRVGLEELLSLPGFKVKDMVSQFHAQRVRQIFHALGRYGKESESWYRVTVLNQEDDSYLLPPGVLIRLLQRGLLSPEETRDVWGRMFVVRRPDRPQEQAPWDRRLRYYEIVSLGPDGQEGTDDDSIFQQRPPDVGLQDLAKALGWETPAGMQLTANEQGSVKVAGFAGGPGSLLLDEVSASRDPMLREVVSALLGLPQKDDWLQTAPKVGLASMAQNLPNRKQKDVGLTLLFAPFLMANERGVADVKFVLPESSSHWTVTIFANSLEGSLGYARHELKVVRDVDRVH